MGNSGRWSNGISNLDAGHAILRLAQKTKPEVKHSPLHAAGTSLEAANAPLQAPYAADPAGRGADGVGHLRWFKMADKRCLEP